MPRIARVVVSGMLQLHERTGQPLGGNTFIEKLESLLRVNLKKKRAGRRKKEK
ncbi:MAG: hypothetical protein ISS45_13295 [Candidatus Omnitrophica bacterium]|nr:hypothetical protein [Candidatus Omnitrophota bacterium]